MAIDNTDAADLKAVPRGGLIREDIMDKIWEIDNFPLVLTDQCTSITTGNDYKEFVTDELGAPSMTNKFVDGADVDQDDTVLGERMGNYHQTSVKMIKISKRANKSNSVGRQGTLSYQVAHGQKRLRRDVEAQMNSHQPSIAGDGDGVPGQSAGIGAWIKTNVLAGVGYVAGGWNPATGLIDSHINGTPEPLSEKRLRDVAQLVYEAGGNTQYLCSVPSVIRLLSEYTFGDTARVATQMNEDTNGTSAMTAYGSTNVFISDFGQILKFMDNRLQLSTQPGVSESMYFTDPKHLFQSFMTGYQTEPIAKTGLSEKRLISVDYSLIITNEKSLGALYDIDPTVPMVP